ncbi:MAG: ribosome biogenesis factor YjgA [Desulfuromonadales bacterium]|jgi:ribosome-associated protein
MRDDARDGERPSRTARKQAAREVEELARQLVELPEGQWKKLPASPEVREEILLARETKGHGSRKRQIKHLAGVLRAREEELEPLRDFLSEISREQLLEKWEFHELEGLRDRLCDTGLFPAALEEAARLMPELDIEATTRLARHYHATGDKKTFREIFRRLRKARQAAAPP